MADIYREIIESLRRKEKVALATLISRVGSAPRGVGAKYLIREDGTTLGSIGGGCVEAEVWQQAQDVMEKDQAGVLHFKLTAQQLAEGGLICGGNIDVLVEPLREGFLDVYEEVLRIRERGETGVLVTLIAIDGKPPEDKACKALFKSSGEKVGFLYDGEALEQEISGEMAGLLKEKRPKVLDLRAKDEGAPWKRIEVLLEPIFSEPTVYLFGAGHVSKEVAPLAKRVHFKVVVIDDREIFANRERFPEADEIVVSDFERSFEGLRIDPQSYIVIVTRGHLYDGLVLEQAVKTDARYIGMIGSKRKIETLYRNLVAKGVPKEKLDRVYAPIGIDINSETPEEIAVSIVAQLIKVRGEAVR
jgi:xanthine dehydrogenase accessory factor